MSRFSLSVLCVLVLVLVSPAAFADTSAPDQSLKDTITSAPSKLCVPKKPITCRTDVSFAPEVATELQAAFEAPVNLSWTQDSRLCYGPRWLCAAPEVEKIENKSEEVKATEVPVQISWEQDSRLCYGPRWLCAAVDFVL